MKRAAAYIRVSTDKQADEKTHKTQIDEIKLRVNDDGNILAEDLIYLDDGWSGAYLERPALDELRQDAREGKFELLYVYDKGRLSRIYWHQEIVLDELARYEIEFISLHDINGKTPEEQAMSGVMGVFHQYERVKTAERFRLAKLSKVRGGNLLGYNPPYGYDYIPIKGTGQAKINGQFVIKEQEAEVVQMLMDWVGNQGFSLRQCRKKLHELAIPPRKAKQAIWTTGPLLRLLSNETYIGKHHYYKSESCLPKNPKTPTDENRYKNRHSHKTSRKARPRDEWIEVAVTPLVEKELFDRVQTRLDANKKFSRRNNKRNDYLLTGLMVCSCGQSRTGDPGANGNLYYRCTNRLHKFPLQRTCDEGGVSATILDAIVWRKLEALLSNPAQIKKHADKWLKDQQRQSNTITREQLEGQLRKLLAEEQRYATAYGNELMSDEVYRDRMSDVFERRKQLSERRDELESVDVQRASISAQELVDKTATLFKGIDFDLKKDVVRRVIDKIEINQKESTIWGLIPVTSDGKVGLNAQYRDCRAAECREVNAV